MKNKLSLKVASLDAPAPLHTPIDQMVSTPQEPPHGASYFLLYSLPQCADSDDVLTDADEPRVLRNHSLVFTPLFDLLLWGVYTQLLLQPTTKPFLGPVPPSGLASRAANDTVHALIRHLAETPTAVYDAQGSLTVDALNSRAHQPVILLLIRKRLLDLCLLQSTQAAPPAVTAVQVAVPQLVAQAPLLVYMSFGARQLSISNLLLTEQNVAQYQGSRGGAPPLSLNRLRLSSLSLRKHSLTRNNSGTNWLHVGNISSGRGGLGNPDLGASTDLLQLMTDFVPAAFVSRPQQQPQQQQGLQGQNQQQQGMWGAQPGFNSMMLDYQTPPTSAKSSFSQGSTPPSTQRDAMYMNTPGSAVSEYEDFAPVLLRSRSSSRGLVGSLPKPLTINTDSANFLLGMSSSAQTPGAQEALNSPFVGVLSEDGGYFPLHSSGNLLPGLLSSAVIPESPKDMPMASGNNKINLPGQFSLSEKKRDSLKMKRGIH